MRQAREREMIDNLNRESIHHYLRGLEVTSYTDQMASRITKSSAEKIVYSLKNGAIEIPKVKIDVFRTHLPCLKNLPISKGSPMSKSNNLKIKLKGKILPKRLSISMTKFEARPQPTTKKRVICK
jgi:hypothetical protein